MMKNFDRGGLGVLDKKFYDSDFYFGTFLGSELLSGPIDSWSGLLEVRFSDFFNKPLLESYIDSARVYLVLMQSNEENTMRVIQYIEPILWDQDIKSSEEFFRYIKYWERLSGITVKNYEKV